MSQMETHEYVDQLKRLLEQKKVQVQMEIANYPPPIPACDQQFNYLLEQRAAISQALSQLPQLLQQSMTIETIQDFIATMDCISEDEIVLSH